MSDRTGAAVWSFGALVLVLFAFTRSPFFSLASWTIEGHQRLSEAEVVRLSGLEPGQNLFNLDAQRIRYRLEADARIAQASVVRRFPRSVAIRIVERLAVAAVPDGTGSFTLYDREGMAIAAEAEPDPGLPRITGSTPDPVAAGVRTPSGELRRALYFLSLIPPQAYEQVGEVRIESEGSLTLHTRGGIRVLLGDGFELEEKARLLLALLETVHRERGVHREIDLRFPSSPVLR